jgi:hypothetical protein
MPDLVQARGRTARPAAVLAARCAELGGIAIAPVTG